MSLQSTQLRSVTAVVALLGALFFLPAHAQEQSMCGPEIKHEIARILDQTGYHKNPLSENSVKLKQALYEKFGFCVGEEPPYNPDDPNGKSREFCGDLSFAANTDFESMRCCGYDPQKMQFACPVEIKLPYGFGIPEYPGSYEYVLTCVDFDDGAGFVQVALDRVHLSDEWNGNAPDWHFAVIADAKEKMKFVSQKSQTLVARSILSWNVAPSSCGDDKIIWGNAIDYKIRLDP